MKTLLKRQLRHILSVGAIELIAALLIILWLYTGINKLLNHQETYVQMGQSPFIESIAGFMAVTIPTGELMLALSLIFKKTRLLGFYGSLFTMTLFTGYIYIMLNFSPDLPCSCGGVLRQLSWQDHLYLNASFTLLSIFGILLQSSMSVEEIKQPSDPLLDIPND